MSYCQKTRLIHTGLSPCDERHSPTSVSVPVVRTSTVRFQSVEQLRDLERQKAEGARVTTYGRYGLETRHALEDVFCELEGGERCFLAPSGLNAITTTLLSLLNAGDHLLCSDGVYGPVRYFAQYVLNRMGIEVDFVDLSDPNHLRHHIKQNTVCVYLESPSSIFLRFLDLPALSRIAHQHGLWVVADNCWGSGVAYRPLELGADLSVIAGTKYVNGHSDVLIGAIVGKDPNVYQRINIVHYALGVSVSSDDAWLAVRGSKTIGLRMQQQAHNALQIVHHLSTLPVVKKIYHPAYEKDESHALWQRDACGSNGLLTLELDLTPAQMSVFVNALQLFAIGYSWGGYESLIQWVEEEALQHHSCWQANGHQVARLHIGLEDPTDLWQDIQQALEQALNVSE